MNKYDFDDIINQNNFYKTSSEDATSEKMEIIESLFDEWDDIDKNEETSNYEISNTPLIQKDNMDATSEISNVDLKTLKELQTKLHELQDEPESSLDEQNNVQSKGKTLTKATKAGIAFSNGNLTKTFLDCTVLCSITAAIGSGWFMYIINHI